MAQQDIISPISPDLQQQVRQKTAQLLQIAESYYQRSFPVIPVLFDLRGKSAGMYRVQGGKRVIRYNPYIFARYFEDNFSQTIPHEVAHYITDVLYGLRQIRPHGSEWKSVMAVFGAEPSRTAIYDLTGIPQRQYRRFVYRCDCQNYELTTRRHNKILRGQGHYLCRECGSRLLFVAEGK